MNKKTSTMDLSLSNNERLNLYSSSPFKPKKFQNLIPSGLKFFSFHAGFKNKNNDLLVIVFEKVINVSCVYSLTSTPSAPIIWDKKYNKGKCKVLIVNSGNANAHTGSKGIKIIDKYVSKIIKKIKCKKSEVLVSSTGVIGELFNPYLIIKSINKIEQTKSTDLISAASSIMTTDTFPKTIVKKIKIQNKTFNIFGIAKGSGMIQPNMGTMLAYIFIDCFLSKKNLKKLLYDNLDDTFNSISVDGDTSTSDTLMIFSLPNKKVNLDIEKNYELLSKNLYDVMEKLAYQVILDGEGVSKIIKVNITNAKTKLQAKNIAFSIVNSPLVKTAVAGEDANWGRIIMAIGKSYEKIDQNKIKISFGNNIVCRKGQINQKINYKKLNLYMKKNQISINIDLGLGVFNKRVYGNDLTNNYIKINADYRS